MNKNFIKVMVFTKMKNEARIRLLLAKMYEDVGS